MHVGYTYNCKIVKVIDGDTVDIDIDLGFSVWLHKQRIRLYGIDTPESRTRDKEEKKYGLLAKKQIQFWLPKSSFQTLITIKDKTGKFGRILGKFKINDTTAILNDWMVENHYAVAYYGQSKDEIIAQHLENRENVTIR